jgi:hypothetical protein
VGASAGAHERDDSVADVDELSGLGLVAFPQLKPIASFSWYFSEVNDDSKSRAKIDSGIPPNLGTAPRNRPRDRRPKLAAS